MKKISALILGCLILISACVLYLLKSGISLRAQSLITPSAMSSVEEVSGAVMARLFPDFQNAHYVVLGFLPLSGDSEKLFNLLRADYEKSFHRPPQILEYSESLTPEVFKACAPPCWILTEAKNANLLKPGSWIEKSIQTLDESFFTLSFLPFQDGEKATDECMHEKRLDFACLTPVSVQQAQKKIKPGRRNFFLNSYNDRDFFIFVQN